MVERMKQMSGAMDDLLQSMNGRDDADMGCGSEAMQVELVRHRVAACASSDMAANRAEALAARGHDGRAGYAPARPG